ncbi:MAG: acetyl-CoA carboxylase biotin carboxyl carrier protein [Planctomycetaceae bacterium]|nr:acetyl-CoA carboxylase biotin carboxyl carrier protein [Planctomycetaceae bacterium]
MAEKGQSKGESFDLDQIKQLIRLMEKHDLSEIKLKEGDQKWVLRRGAAAYSGQPIATAAPAPSASVPSDGGAASSASGDAGADDGLVKITSPTVGTFYGAPQPGDPPFVKVGDRVTRESVVCIVEAMKVFNQIPAEVTGTIRQSLVQDGEAVEFGQALFLVKPD